MTATASVGLESLFEANRAEPALIGEGFAWTYGDLANRAAGIAHTWRESGAVAGDRVALRLPNGPEFLAAYLAAAIGGFTIVPVNSGLTDTDLGYILDATAPRLVVDDPEQVTGKSADFSGEFAVRDDDVFAIFFTSGTTNRPKGVCHTLANMVANVRAFNDLTGVDHRSRMLHVLPMGYMAGFLNTFLSPLIAGGSICIAPQFSAATAGRFWRPAIDHEVDTVWLTPTMAALLTRFCKGGTVAAWTAENMTRVFVGTAPLLDPVRTPFESAFGVRCLESYGMTELLLVASNRPDDHCVSGSVGHLVAGVETRFAADHREMTGTGDRLWIRTPYACRGYWNPVDGSIADPRQDDWFSTGDCGLLEGDRLCITGRTKDLIIKGGTNISPRAVEELLLSHPRVKEVAVVGIPHEFWGEEVAAAIVADDVGHGGNDHLLAELTSLCKQHLQAEAVPGQWRVVSELPKSSTGKTRSADVKGLF